MAASAGAGEGDQPAIGAQTNQPGGLAFDAEGNLYLVDARNSLVRKMDKAGIITTVVGGAS